MKKLICLLLVFIMLFCGCSHWKVEIVDPTKPVENDSELVDSEDETEESEDPEEKEEQETEEPEEKYEPKPVETSEAESFFYSDEGFEDMAFFASWLGAKDFESSEETVDSGMFWFFAKEFYEAVGEEALDSEGFFFRIPERLGNRYLLKYFGVDYLPKEDDPNFEKETNSYKIATSGGGAPYELISYDHPVNVEENKFSVKMLILEGKYEDTYYAFSEMVFEVLEDDDGKFLRLVSNKVSEHFSKAPFEMQAQSLAKQMLKVMNKANIESENIEISNHFAANFAMQAAVFVNASNGFDKDSPYVGSFGKRSGYSYYLPVKEVERIAFEVFGIEDFQYGFNSNFEYDSEKDEYLTGFEWGMEGGYGAKDMTTTVSGNVYSVEFTLRYVGANSEGNPEWMDGEKYIMHFELVENKFLRYIGFEKA